MTRRLVWSDVFTGAVLVATGIAIVGLMAYPMISPRQAFEVARTPSVRAAFERRWGSLPPPLPDPPAFAKTDRLTTDAKPLGPLAALQPPVGEAPAAKSPPPAPIEQARERKVFEDDVEHATSEYRHEARHIEEQRDVCARHGMHKRYFHTHHGRHLSWRCVGHYRR